MSTLLLRLAGPLQAWGDSSRFTRRETRDEPTKSGVLGLLAAAMGRRRTDAIEDLLGLRFGVRVDQTGRLVRDFQTAQQWSSGRRMPLSYRYYLADAVFVAGVEGDAGLLADVDAAVRTPAFPLYLGRRACPPARQISMGVVRGDVVGALRAHPWEASTWYRRTMPRHVVLRLLADARDEDDGGQHRETVRDVPLSFDPERREYGWREVVELAGVPVENPQSRRPAPGMGFFEVVAAG